MAKNRESRQQIDKSNIDLLKPIDVLSLGGEDDPCFGKLHDLKAPECMECGDSEFCAIVKAQNLHKERLEIESTQRFKDIEEADHKMVDRRKKAKKLIRGYMDNGLKRMKIILKVSRETNLSKDVIKQLYEQI